MTPATLPDGQVGATYNQALSASNCIFPCVYTDPFYSLAPGLTMGANGTISGTPLMEGPFVAAFTIINGNGDSDEVAYHMNNRPVISFAPLACPTARASMLLPTRPMVFRSVLPG